MSNIIETVDRICPLEKTIPRGTPWINQGVFQAQKIRDQAYNKFKYTKYEEDWVDYKTKRNKVTTIVRQEKRKYFERKIDNSKHNSKEMWRTVKELIGQRKEKLNIDNIQFGRYNGTIEENFNNYYRDSIEEIAKSIEHRPLQIVQSLQIVRGPKDEFLAFKEISFNQLNKIVLNLQNKSSSDNCLSIRLMKNLFCVMGYQLLNLINTILLQGQIPVDLKVSVIVPIAKVTSPTCPEDCRPINLLPSVDKIVEIILKEQLQDFFEKNNLVYYGQSGFREQYSCETALQFVCANWRKEINNNKIVLSVFVDLKRAFETINRDILVAKLESYGIKEGALRLIKDYLTERYHRTVVGNNMSTKSRSCYGVPQGSVLGPLLFIVYINDIPKLLQKSFVSLFADDTLLSVSGDNFVDVVDTLNKELDILYNWLCANKLKLNSGKTKLMVLGTRTKCNQFESGLHIIKINGTTIQRVYEMKYLGVIVDPQLTFSTHVDFLCKKLGKKIGFFRRISNDLSPWSKMIVYNTIISPHFSYCNSLLLSCPQECINRLQVLQNKCMRILLNCNIYTSVNSMLERLNWLSVGDSIKRNNIVLIFKIIHRLVPNYLAEFLVKRFNLHGRELRSKDDFNVDFTHKSFLMGTLFQEGVRLFNVLPSGVKDIENLHTFKVEIYKIFKQQNCMVCKI